MRILLTLINGSVIFTYGHKSKYDKCSYYLSAENVINSGTRTHAGFATDISSIILNSFPEQYLSENITLSLKVMNEDNYKEFKASEIELNQF